MPSVETILNKGFSNGSPWDRTAWRKALMLWFLPLCALLIAVGGGMYIYNDMQQDYPVGYVVSSSDDCTLVVAARPDGPPVDTVQEHSGGKFASCGGLPKNTKIHYDPDQGVQAFGKSNDVVGMVFVPVVALLAGIPGILAWINTLQKRRARKETAVPPTHAGQA